MPRLLCLTELGSHPPFDTTVELYSRIAADPRFELWHADSRRLGDGRRVPAVPIEGPLDYDRFQALDERPVEERPLDSFDLVYCRTDKPFPEGHHERLAAWEPGVRFANSPRGLSRMIGRDFMFGIAGAFLPPSIVTADADEAQRFLAEHGEVVAKRRVSYGGKGVFRVSRNGAGWRTENVIHGERDFGSCRDLFSWLFSLDEDPFELVRFMRRIDAGDKRVLVVDGEIYGAYLRRSPSGHWVHNITAGGEHLPATVSAAECRVIEATVPFYRALDVHTLGYDFLMGDDGEWTLSEINAGNIGGYGRLESLINEPVYARLLDWLMKRAAAGTCAARA